MDEGTKPAGAPFEACVGETQLKARSVRRGMGASRAHAASFRWRLFTVSAGVSTTAAHEGEPAIVGRQPPVAPKSNDDAPSPRYKRRARIDLKTLLAVLIVACPTAASAWPSAFAPPAQVPHPAVARIIVAEKDGTSMGSGSLV